MEAGRELDALLAEKLWDLTRVELPDIREHYPHYLDVSDSGKQTIWVNNKGELVYCTTCGNMPALSTTGDGMLKVIEGLTVRGYAISIRPVYDNIVTVALKKDGEVVTAYGVIGGERIPYGVAYNAAIALGAIKEG